jgi:DNA-binding response OmpR family regulator
MILLVDDDPLLLREVAGVLEGDGHAVRTASSGAEALALLAEEPELVLCDVRMPGMDGIELRRRYADLFPARSTPFAFLTSLGDSRDVVGGLEAGADDYLVKPVPPGLLKAKVRALLRSRSRWGTPVFRGDLSRCSFIQVLRFCETNGLTGTVEFDTPAFRTMLAFQAGAIGHHAEDQDDSLESLHDASEGTFTIRSATIDFGDLSAFAVPEPLAGRAEGSRPGPPAGRLSTLTLGERTFRIQTELAAFPRPAVVTGAFHDWRGILKRVTENPPVDDPEALEALIESQHALVEAELRANAASPVESPAKGTGPEKERFDRLFEEGIEAYLAKDYPGALRYWREAERLRPGDGVLTANIHLVRRKVEGTGR